ncbi:hypothetical protein GobsT_70570 [Gemmata obscuriglobus]|uniref:Integrase catalytic domain-containing protein n=1 Tax=Gemmata obscuriglobus TaxID=114 RepID=A0A2Z3H4V8_9BACT|nr:hypothetical protein C1280_35785 [Gemmata obscuriglobus]QEG32205.1 hypothetical protein GobsT_70570 [Gemmata obscuriglobus]VTS11558.1 Transposase OS=Aeromonas hydrophila GN=OI71_16020 PE=4 SV=1: rve_2 [Gemmata obscuriglobus UQM 2246]
MRPATHKSPNLKLLELVHDEDYATRDEAKASIVEYIEAFDNRVRRHSSLGDVAPDEYERTHNQTHR